MGFFDFLFKKAETQKTNISVPRAPVLRKIQMPERQEKQPIFLSSCKDFPQTNDYVAFYRRGSLYNVKPRNESISLDEDRGIAYDARYFVSDDIKYDLESPESIESIIIPKFGGIDGAFASSTRDLSYILKMRATKENRPEIAVPLCYTVANLMIASPISWSKKDYFRLVIQLWSIGEIYYADFLLSELRKYVPEVTAEDEEKKSNEKNFNEALKLAKELNTDYLQTSDLESACPECAPFKNRVYSISGKSKRFPALPDFIKENKGLHCPIAFFPFQNYSGCTLDVYTYENSEKYEIKAVSAIKHSNRPFVDDRTEYEKQCYEKRKEQIEKKKQADEKYYNRERWIEEYRENFEYQQIVDLMGDSAPKNYSSYKRMKKNQTATFKKIETIAKENGIEI